MSDYLKIIGANIHRLRNMNGLSQERFSMLSGIEINGLEMFEKGQLDMYILTLAHIAKIFGVSISELLQPTAVDKEVLFSSN